MASDEWQGGDRTASWLSDDLPASDDLSAIESTPDLLISQQALPAPQEVVTPSATPTQLIPTSDPAINSHYNGFVVIPDSAPTELIPADSPASSDRSTAFPAPQPAPLAPSPTVSPLAPSPTASDRPTVPESRPTATTAPVGSVGSVAGEEGSMSQVTSVTQLSDVAPTDWAYQALASLVERYGCIAGYPDGTFRGNQPLSRYEFAAGLNACLDRISSLLSGGGVGSADLLTLERLQEEYAAELATLRGRVDALEARTAELEANQFSTTTKLNGNVIFATAAALAEDSQFSNQATFGYRMRMNFDSSFTGSDRLRIRLQARDFREFEGDTIGFSFGGASGDDDIELDSLFYDFPVTSRIDARIGANGLAVDDLVSSTISPLDSSTDGSLSAFGFPPQYSLAAPGNAGAGAIVQVTNNLSLDFGYTASNASNPQPSNGLFNGDFGMIAQLTFLSSRFDGALTYVRGYSTSGFATTDPETANTYGAQINYRLSDAIEIGGGAAYIDSSTSTSDLDIWSYQLTLAFPDLFGSGHLGGILVGVPPRIADASVNDQRIPALIEDASLVVEGFYRYQLNNNVSITPGLIWVADPGNDNSISDSVIGTIRTVFRF
ncbi:MAG TPA: iron uptake porin [Candidatus Obscuribacterales bacterium]